MQVSLLSGPSYFAPRPLVDATTITAQSIRMMIIIVEYDEYNSHGQGTDMQERDMGHSQADKAHSREKILREAADQVRDNGLESISVGKLMRSVELTHGGFYNHFESRSELLAQALERALSEGRKASLAGADPQAPRSFEATLRSFLSRTHRDSRAGGCAIAALASDVARADERSRGVMSQHIDSFVAQIANSLGTDDEGDAMLAVSAMIGALLLSRVQVDPKRSDALLKTVRERLLALQRSDEV
jgi:TetR/AcrR family transcriptional regulator, transcriptional repressor for nem operon